MSTHIEWHDAASTRVIPIRPADIEELADEGNDAKHWGLSIETSEASIVYGTVDQLTEFAEQVMSALDNIKQRNGMLRREWVTP